MCHVSLANTGDLPAVCRWGLVVYWEAESTAGCQAGHKLRVCVCVSVSASASACRKACSVDIPKSCLSRG